MCVAHRGKAVEQRLIGGLQQRRQLLAKGLSVTVGQGVEHALGPLLEGRGLQRGEQRVRHASEGFLQRHQEQQVAGTVRCLGRQPQQVELSLHPPAALLLPAGLISQREAGIEQLLHSGLAGVLAAGGQ
ncbi:hypothetical protein [Hyalangium gracile]|uniref:hypothetical protein n=1 Tax=Hyalangium gracile TaxID=394092 RepID=UPI001CCCB401|nr:hypothetical protein [Hyalangium gracile]